ncbi:SH3 domain-containing protein [Umezawaea beigongshangensis]|uniref:SH3 domain-containing protein n=1 Tax=Umezawaea beigongshangensis TaxID=2780383 RepID=UPI0018F1FED6|nr:SH3 domain-containing protein [Umezawaea beigongshangensis]
MRTTIQRAAGAVAVGAAAVVLVATPANAAPKGDGQLGVAHAPCGTSGPNLDPTITTGATAGSRLRTGSATNCTAVGTNQPSHRLDYYCYTRGNDGATWTYLHNLTTGVRGWTRDDLLPGNGSSYHCGF